MNWLKDILVALFHPATWIQVYPYNVQWDVKLKKLMHTNTFHRIDPAA